MISPLRFSSTFVTCIPVDGRLLEVPFGTAPLYNVSGLDAIGHIDWEKR